MFVLCSWLLFITWCLIVINVEFNNICQKFSCWNKVQTLIFVVLAFNYDFVCEAKFCSFYCVAYEIVIKEVAMAFNPALLNYKDMLVDNLSRYAFLVNEKATVFVLADTEFRTTKMAEANIVDLLHALGILDSLIELSPLEFPAYKYIRFAESKDKDKFVKEFSQCENYTVFKADEFVNSRIVKFSVSWMPLVVLYEELPKIMEKYGKVISIRATMRKINDKISYLTTPVYVTFKLMENVELHELPYSFYSSSNCRAWLHFPNRKKVCFRCQDDTHSIKECKVRWCRACNGFCVTGHNCRALFSNIVKAGGGDLSFKEVSSNGIEAETNVEAKIPMQSDMCKMQQGGDSSSKMTSASDGIGNNEDTTVSVKQDLLARAILQAKLELENRQFSSKMNFDTAGAYSQNMPKKQKLQTNNGIIS